MFTHEGSVQTSRPDMIASQALKPIVQSFDNLPNVPLLTDVIVDGRAKALLGLVTTPSHIGLPLIGPPGMASDRLGYFAEIPTCGSWRTMSTAPRPTAAASRRTRAGRRRVAADHRQKLVLGARARR